MSVYRKIEQLREKIEILERLYNEGFLVVDKKYIYEEVLRNE